MGTYFDHYCMYVGMYVCIHAHMHVSMMHGKVFFRAKLMTLLTKCVTYHNKVYCGCSLYHFTDPFLSVISAKASYFSARVGTTHSRETI